MTAQGSSSNVTSPSTQPNDTVRSPFGNQMFEVNVPQEIISVRITFKILIYIDLEVENGANREISNITTNIGC